MQDFYTHTHKKKKSLYKRIHSVKQTHSVQDEFYFQFIFATNEQV